MHRGRASKDGRTGRRCCAAHIASADFARHARCATTPAFKLFDACLRGRILCEDRFRQHACYVSASLGDYDSLGDGECVAFDNKASTAKCTAPSWTIIEETMCRHKCDWLEACVGYTWRAPGAPHLVTLLRASSQAPASSPCTFSPPGLRSCHSPSEIVACADICMLYSGFGTFDGMAELSSMLSLPDGSVRWKCEGSVSITASNGEADGSRCWLKG